GVASGGRGGGANRVGGGVGGGGGPPPGASARRSVEALRVLAQNLATRLIGERREPLFQLANDAKGGVDVRVVGRPDEGVGAEVLDHLSGHRLVGVRRDQALAVDIRAGRASNRG